MSDTPGTPVVITIEARGGFRRTQEFRVKVSYGPYLRNTVYTGCLRFGVLFGPTSANSHIVATLSKRVRLLEKANGKRPSSDIPRKIDALRAAIVQLGGKL